MKASTEALIAVGLFAATGLVAYVIYKKAAGLGESVAEFGARLWDGPPTAAADYQQSVQQATTQPGAFFPSYSVSPYDLIPAGYTMNQYGDLVKTQQNYGVSGSW